MGTVDHIYAEVLATYPFLTSEERLAFAKKAREFWKRVPPLNLVEQIDGVLKLLHNPHATIWPVKKDKHQRPLQKPELKIEDKLLYIKVPTWTKKLTGLAEELINFCQKNEDQYQAVIVDVRDNQGGSSTIAHQLAGIFFQQDVTFGKFISRVKGDGLLKKDAVMPANKEIYIDKPLAILISNRCFSSNELFLAPFKVTGRATLVGEKTAGGSGNPVAVEVNIDGERYVVRIPTWRFILKGENRPIEETAIVPDIACQKKDAVDYARKYLKEKV